MVNVVVEILLIHNSHNVVDIIIIHRQPGKSGVGESLSDLGFRRIERNADDVDTRSKDLCGLHLHEADCILNQIAFTVVDVALWVASSTMVISSSSVMPWFSEDLKMRESSFFHWEKKTSPGSARSSECGETVRKIWRSSPGILCNAFRGNFAEDQDHDSGYDRGNRRTGVAAENLDKKHRGKELSPMLTMLLPTRIVESSLSKFSSSFNTSSARLSPFSAIFFMRMRFSEVKEVSVAEK